MLADEDALWLVVQAFPSATRDEIVANLLGIVRAPLLSLTSPPGPSPAGAGAKDAPYDGESSGKPRVLSAG
jgi:hypothetical protein